MRSLTLAMTSACLALCCGPRRPALEPSDGSYGGAKGASGARGRAHTDSRHSVRVSQEGGKGRPMTVHEAEQYLLELVNRDRAKHGLAAVEWDEHAARAGRVHAQDMAKHGYTAHWGTDGSVPEQRYTEAGGTSYVQENAACLADAATHTLDERPVIYADQVEQVEAAFMNEKPPNDGHRRNILTAWHNQFGAGVAKPAGVPVVCVAEEFTDVYGSYASVPARAHVGSTIEISGEVKPPARFGGVGLARISLPAARSAEDLNQTHSYRIPQPYVSYFPKGFVSPLPVDVKGNRFTIRVPLSEQAQSGLYEVSVWAHLPQTPNLVMISLRTIEVR